MSSQNALTSTAGSAVAWQVDISNLSSLIYSLGSAGLRQLAMAGVDPHIIACMWKIAEVCPASNEYRREISLRRQEQRSQSIWLYKIVEIGAATNFVVDELLKNRAGENVVALMSSILPVMSGKACDTVLLHLFEASGVPLESTPSFGQLRSIRVALESIARKMPFQNKVFQYYIWLKGLFGPELQTESAYDSIPNEETAAFVIRALGKISLGDSTSFVAYYGFKGAAWVATYARYLLNLPVCVMKTASDAIPLSGTYRESRVRLYIYDENVRCETHVEGKLEQFLVPNSLNSNAHAGWTIDTERVDLLHVFFPDSTELKHTLSPFISCLICNFTKVLASSLYFNSIVDKRFPESGFVKYSTYCLPIIRQRARKNFQRFGFDFDDESSFNDATEGLLGRYGGDYVDYEVWRRYVSQLPTNNSSESIFVGPAWPKSESSYTENSRSTSTPELSPKGRRFIRFLWKLAEIASWLAFTNWGEALHTLSFAFLEQNSDTPPMLECISLFNAPTQYSAAHDNKFINHMNQFGTRVETSDLLVITTAMSIGYMENKRDYIDRLAVQIKGVVVADMMATRQRLDLDACFIRFLPGLIQANGERREKIYTKPMNLEFSHNFFDLGSKSVLKPIDSFPDLEVIPRVELSGLDISISLDIFISGKVSRTDCPLPNSVALANLYVTKECDHHYYDECRFLPLALSQTLLDGEDIGQGLWLDQCYLQQVDRNTCGQWIACLNGNLSQRASILQRHACLQCVVGRFKMYAQRSKQHLGSFSHAFIIPGRFEGEPMAWIPCRKLE